MPRAAARTRKSETVLPGTPVEVSDELRLRMALERLTVMQLTRLGSMSFIEFCEVVLAIVFTPAQRMLCAVLFDGATPEGPIGRALFGDWAGPADAGIYRKIASTVLAVCGRGSGKTSIIIAARALHLALSCEMVQKDGTPLGKTEAALVAVVAPDQRQSRHALSFVKGLLVGRPALAQALHYESTLDIIRITRPDGHPVTIEARPATSGGKAVRGPSLAGVVLDEAHFFYSEGYEVSDVEIYRAAIPRLLRGGQIVLGTTPWAQTGLVWDLFRDNWGHPVGAIVAKAPTLLMRPSAEMEETVAAERLRDPDNAAREFDAEFLSADAERFFPETLLERVVDLGLVHIPGEPILVVNQGERVRFGGDFAFDADSSALVGFVERVIDNKPMLLCCELDEQRPKPGAPLVPSEVVSDFARKIKRAGGRIIVADAHYRRSIEEHLSAAELALVPSDGVPAEGFLVVRALMAQGRVRIPKHSRLLAQLRRVRSTHKPGGTVTIHQPRARDGGHGDIVSALVCSLAGVSLQSQYAVAGPSNALEAEAMAITKARDEKMKKQVEDHDKMQERGFRRRFGVGARTTMRRLFTMAQGGR